MGADCTGGGTRATLGATVTVAKPLALGLADAELFGMKRIEIGTSTEEVAARSGSIAILVLAPSSVTRVSQGTAPYLSFVLGMPIWRPSLHSKRNANAPSSLVS